MEIQGRVAVTVTVFNVEIESNCLCCSLSEVACSYDYGVISLTTLPE